jgi:hypothetical protein
VRCGHPYYEILFSHSDRNGPETFLRGAGYEMVFLFETMHIMSDISSETHDNLDADLSVLSTMNFDSRPSLLLFLVIYDCVAAYADVWPIDMNASSQSACGDLLTSRQDIRDLLRTSHATGKYSEIRRLRKWHLTSIQVFTHPSPAEFHKKKALSFEQIFRGSQRYAAFSFL